MIHYKWPLAGKAVPSVASKLLIALQIIKYIDSIASLHSVP
jgi:hypothetical protein